MMTELGLVDSGDRTDLAGTGGMKDIQKGNGRFDLLPFCVLWRLAKHYEAGADKYGDRNWESGLLAHNFIDSAMRHITKYMMGWDDEDHLIAAIWQLCGLAWTEENKPEMIDIPNRKNVDPEVKEIGTYKGDPTLFEIKPKDGYQTYTMIDIPNRKNVDPEVKEIGTYKGDPTLFEIKAKDGYQTYTMKDSDKIWEAFCKKLDRGELKFDQNIPIGPKGVKGEIK